MTMEQRCSGQPGVTMEQWCSGQRAETMERPDGTGWRRGSMAMVKRNETTTSSGGGKQRSGVDGGEEEWTERPRGNNAFGPLSDNDDEIEWTYRRRSHWKADGTPESVMTLTKWEAPKESGTPLFYFYSDGLGRGHGALREHYLKRTSVSKAVQVSEWSGTSKLHVNQCRDRKVKLRRL